MKQAIYLKKHKTLAYYNSFGQWVQTQKPIDLNGAVKLLDSVRPEINQSLRIK